MTQLLFGEYKRFSLITFFANIFELITIAIWISFYVIFKYVNFIEECLKIIRPNSYKKLINWGSRTPNYCHIIICRFHYLLKWHMSTLEADGLCFPFRWWIQNESHSECGQGGFNLKVSAGNMRILDWMNIVLVHFHVGPSQHYILYVCSFLLDHSLAPALVLAALLGFSLGFCFFFFPLNG